ncbi:MAG TPA: pseudouridine synthase [Terriglobales bacterium]|nr:pseudouridine synthase [Terriglobales bacterium]
MSVRLNKLLARRGIGARRKCDVLIQHGLVRVNGEVVREPGTQVEPGRDAITVEGRPLPAQAAPRYYVLNKPVGVITTLDDPEGRRTIRDFLPSGPRLFPVGRLDADTSGLLVLTNDGELAHRLMHPRYGVAKVYRVRVDRAPGPDALRRLERGVEFEPGVRSAPARVRLLSSEPGGALLRIELHEGRYRQVRRMCEAVGLEVRALHRSAYGPLRLGPVARGTWRELSEDEVRALRGASARPHWHGQRGYHGGRTGGEQARRLARRLEKLAGEERETRRAPGSRLESRLEPRPRGREARGESRRGSLPGKPPRRRGGPFRGASSAESARRAGRGSFRGRRSVQPAGRVGRGSSRDTAPGRSRSRRGAPPEGRERPRFEGQNPRRSGRGRSGRGPSRGDRRSRRP